MRFKYSCGIVITLFVLAMVLPFSFDVRPSMADEDSASEPSDLTIVEIVAAVVQTEHFFQNLQSQHIDPQTEIRTGNENSCVKTAPTTRPE
jgi:hypothetical protein